MQKPHAAPGSFVACRGSNSTFVPLVTYLMQLVGLTWCHIMVHDALLALLSISLVTFKLEQTTLAVDN